MLVAASAVLNNGRDGCREEIWQLDEEVEHQDYEGPVTAIESAVRYRCVMDIIYSGAGLLQMLNCTTESDFTRTPETLKTPMTKSTRCLTEVIGKILIRTDVPLLMTGANGREGGRVYFWWHKEGGGEHRILATGAHP